MAQTITEEFLARADRMAADGCSLGEADAVCRELTARHYENFPVFSRLLPEPQRGALCAVYAFARFADDFADEARFGGERAERLGEWRAWLFEAAADDHPHPVFKALSAVMARHRLPAKLLARLIDAFEQDTRQTRYDTWEELLDYCSKSADPVGRIVLRVFGRSDDLLDQQSDVICTGLQLANHWQDIGDDLSRDRIYVPRECLKRFGVAEDMLFDRLALPNVTDMIAELVRRTWGLFEEGRDLPTQVDRPLARWIRLVWLGGTAILRKIESQGFDTLTQRPTLSRADKIMLALRGLLLRRLPRGRL